MEEIGSSESRIMLVERLKHLQAGQERLVKRQKHFSRLLARFFHQSRSMVGMSEGEEEKENKEAEQEYENLLKMFCEAEGNLTDLKRAFQDENSRLQGELTELESNVKKELDAFRKAGKWVWKKCRHSIAKTKAPPEVLEEFFKDYEASINRLKGLRAKNQALQKELGALTMTLDEVCKITGGHRVAEYEEGHVRVQELTEKIERKQEELQRLETQIVQTLSTRDHLREKLLFLRNQNRDLKEEVKNLEAQVSQAKQRKRERQKLWIQARDRTQSVEKTQPVRVDAASMPALVRDFYRKKTDVDSLKISLEHLQREVSTVLRPDDVTTPPFQISVSGIAALKCNEKLELSVTSDVDMTCDLSQFGWESDSESYSLSALEDSADVFLESQRQVPSRVLRNNDIIVIIPEPNDSGFEYCDFGVKTLDDPHYRPKETLWSHVVSDIVSVEPHGFRFSDSHPASIFIPLKMEVGEHQAIQCLLSNTCEEEKPCWEKVPAGSYAYSAGRVIITVNHFSLFTVIIQEPYPETRRRISGRLGGSINVSAVPGVKVIFPKGSLNEDIDAFVRVLYDDEFSNQECDEWALASPVIMLGPHGYDFNEDSDPVVVQLPIPHYMEIKSKFPLSRELQIYQSSTTEDEPLHWEKISVQSTVTESIDGIYVVCFPVHHFSFFKVVWDLLSASLYEAKLGMAYFYPYISFSMMCQAWMEENTQTNRFGLEVVCCRSDRQLPEMTNYKYKVGASLKPKLVRPGHILIRLRSQMFEADEDAGEDPEMVKEEPDFRGRDFEKQYACRFKPNVKVERGTFGKVVVERNQSGTKTELLFEFNLHKSGDEGEPNPPENTHHWSAVAMKELAVNLCIMDDNNWKKFAKYIGFTKNEIATKLQYAADPLLATMNLYQARGGTPEEFCQALRTVSRQLQLGLGKSSGSSSQESSSSQGSHLSNGWFGFRSPLKWRNRDTQSDSGTGTVSQKSAASRKRSNHSKGSGSSAAKRRKQDSDSDEALPQSSSSSDTEDEGSVSTEHYRRNPIKLSDADLWDISAHMNSINWRALGRTLGLEESVLLNIEHAHKAAGFRECSYQMLLEWKGRKPKKCTFGNLYTALTKENMNSVAKQMTTMNMTESPV
ncbi:unnamed protein product [Darwinula stevensoni]|uniref:Death domain-containing protein n=1 Tax=Darwinula stevensoni TaxID=69355 RepID=A0A7R9A2N2_9CRUS|nr:unnamed protein product [Darwinula stevensoni]CAG0879835.1 unnamed protein product [Darwinula stevensoni]